MAPQLYLSLPPARHTPLSLYQGPSGPVLTPGYSAGPGCLAAASKHAITTEPWFHRQFEFLFFENAQALRLAGQYPSIC